MNEEELAGRLAAVEVRLLKIEAFLEKARRTGWTDSEQSVRPPAKVVPHNVDSEVARERLQQESMVGGVLGWTGGIALLLAASYLIRLGIDYGWLTPERQVGLAAILAFVLIGAGFFLRTRALRYAGLLPAVGVAILFLAIYGGHLYYRILEQKEAGLAVIAVCAGSLWLCRVFQSDLYAFFAVIGSYSAPFLLAGAQASLVDLVIYFSAWSVVFCVFSILQGRRGVYLWALYLSLIGFDVIWRGQHSADWETALIFQTVQFAIFGATTALYSMRRHDPLDPSKALAHLPPLLLFYVLQYGLLQQHMPASAPWIAFGSLAAVAALYGLARVSIGRVLPGGEMLLWAYAAIVLVHAGYIESVPKEWQPWVAFFAVPVIALLALHGTTQIGPRWPIWLAIALVFSANYVRIIRAADSEHIPARHVLAVCYALLLYASYWLLRGREALAGVRVLLLYMGHICAMAAAVHILHEPIIESTMWGLLAIGGLGLSLVLKDTPLRQSSLVLFGVTGAKVLLLDLRGASPVARIVSLLALGFMFYFGGLMYQRVLGVATSKK